MEEKKNGSQFVHIYDRSKIEMSGVLEVLSSTDKEVFVRLEDSVGCVVGEKMTITKLVPEDQLLVVSGYIFGVSFKAKIQKKTLLKKVFK